MQKRSLRIIKIISKELNIDEDVVKAVVESQFQCAREHARLGENGDHESFYNIRFVNLGLLVASKGKINAIEKNKNKQINK